MIAFPAKRRGRPTGSKNVFSRPTAQQVPGAATSACKMARRVGVAEHTGAWLYVPREGWVRWVDLQAQVARAYERWRAKKAAEGVLILDAAEQRQIDIMNSGAMGAVRAAWLRDWQRRHAELCVLAEFVEGAA